jgi:oligopeptide transport system substrate-binding protein
LELKTADTAYGASNTIQSIQSDLKSVGVDVHVSLEDGGVHFESLNVRNFQLGSAAWIADYDDPMTFLALLQSKTGQQNYGDYDNPKFDALLAASDNEPDAGKRAEILAQAEKLAMDDANLVPLFNLINSNMVSPHITGWVDNDADIHPIRLLCRDDAGRQPGK